MSASQRTQFQKIAQEYFQALQTGDKAAILKLIGSQIAHNFNNAPTEIGVAAFEKFLDLKFSLYEETFDDLKIYTDDSGENGAAQFRLNGIYRKTYPGLPEACGQKYSIGVGAFLRLSEGKINSITTYFNFDEWLKQISKRA